MAALAAVLDKRWVALESHGQEPAVDSLLRHARLTGLPTKAWKTKREERQYKLRLRGLDEIWRDFVEYFKLIILQKISSWQQRNHSSGENRPKERNFFRTLSKKGDKMSFSLHYCFGMAKKSHLKQILQSFRASCLDAKPTIYRFCRRSGDKIDALKHGTWKLISTLRTEYLSTSDSRWKKGYTRRDVSFSPHEKP